MKTVALPEGMTITTLHKTQEQLDRIEAKLDLLIDLLTEEEDEQPIGMTLEDEAMDFQENEPL